MALKVKSCGFGFGLGFEGRGFDFGFEGRGFGFGFEGRGFGFGFGGSGFGFDISKPREKIGVSLLTVKTVTKLHY